MERRHWCAIWIACVLTLLNLSGPLMAHQPSYIPDKAYLGLKNIYELHCRTPSDINEHLPVLRSLASRCHSVAELGVRNLVSTWALLLGLSRPLQGRSTYIGIDKVAPPAERLSVAAHLSEFNGIDFHFWQADDMTVAPPAVDLLFIDSLHTYCHLFYELETFAPQVAKFIALHDTSEPWGYSDDSGYEGDYSEYPAHYDRSKRGLWAAVEDFLALHPEWQLEERRFNNHGLTILRRVY